VGGPSDRPPISDRVTAGDDARVTPAIKAYSVKHRHLLHPKDLAEAFCKATITAKRDRAWGSMLAMQTVMRVVMAK